MSLQKILLKQRDWASRHNLPVVRDYTATLEANLFQPLNLQTRSEFEAADGNELGSEAKRGKMCSLRSSSALAVNVFDYWRNRPLLPLAQAFGAADLTELQFEQKFPHGVGPKSPNIDVILRSGANTAVAIECKFAEPFGKTKPYGPLAEKYLPKGRELWEQAGLRRCQAAAEAIGVSLLFRKLNAGQLLKHALGLSRAVGTRRPLRLVYLWYDPDSAESIVHRSELHTFKDALDGEIALEMLTYQDLFDRIKSASRQDYADYLRDRYFAS